MSASQVAEHSAPYELQGAADAVLGQAFDLLATAPQGVAKLRELILSLAVQGKLVPQDPSDEPASVLLRMIRAEKTRLATDRRVKQDKLLAAIDEEQLPFKVPLGWEWVTFGAIAEIERGGSPRPIQSFLTNDPNGLNWIKIGDTDKGGKYITTTTEKIRREGLCKTRMVFPGDFLLTNSMSFGRPYITQIEGCIHDGWLRISPPSSLNKDYLFSLLSSQFIRRLFVAAAAGGVVLNLNADKVRNVPIPLPPLAEQARIVARVEELMQLCDALEAHGRLQDEQHARLVATVFDALAASESAHAMAENWQRIAAHFDLLLDRPEAVDVLEQTILQLAVRGLLVPQDPVDEPSIELLSRIRAEKTGAGHASESKREQSQGQNTIDASFFEAPNGWLWGTFDQTWDSSFYGPRFAAGDYVATGGTPTIRTTDMSNGRITLKNAPCVSVPEAKRKLYLVRQGDLLVTRSGSIGVMALFDLGVDAIPSAYLIRLRFNGAVAPEFAHLFLISPMGSELLGLSTTSVGVPNVSASKMAKFPMPLPPLAEQRRIVARVEQLRRLCTDLRERLQQARATQSQLADALVSASAQSPSC